MRQPTTEARSAIMRAVKATNTTPERAVRSLLHRLGYRFRLHARELPGKPDIVFRKRKIAIFVHGCFWHGHECARGARVPKTNAQYWAAKITRNRARDVETAAQLHAMGWNAVTIWECALKDSEALEARLSAILTNPS